jgi:hypothetical protein
MRPGIHKVGDNPSRFIHKGKPGDIDLYETWKDGKQTIREIKHKAVRCSKQGCENEATRFYTLNSIDMYVCLEHPDTEAAEESGTYVLPDGTSTELVTYCCDPDCGEEDSEPCEVCHE